MASCLAFDRTPTKSMISFRRFLTCIACTVLFLLIAFELNSARSRQTLVGNNSKTDVYRLASPKESGQFNWIELRPKYPVDTLNQLPPPSGGLSKVQYDFTREDGLEAVEVDGRKQQVREALQRCWQAYRERAWLEDELAPISGDGRNTFGGWGATLVDTLDTLWIADLHDEFRDAVDAAVEIDFSTTTHDTINVFETTIRYLGGFLSAHDLSGDTRLLDKALELAHMLYAAFDTPNRMPNTRWDFHKAAAGEAQGAPDGVLSAEIGSLSLEFTRLSQITHDPKWYDAIARIMSIFEQQQNLTNLPGMWPLVVNPRDEDFFSGTVFTLGAMSDSLYEYLPKMDALLGGSEIYARMYRDSMDAAIQHTIFRPMLPDDADVLISGPVTKHKQGDQSRVDPEGQHLACFAGGMLALGGRLRQNNSHLEIGRKLTDGCIWTYQHSALGVMPESFTVVPCSTVPCAWDESKWYAEVTARASSDDAANGASWIIENKRLPKGFSSIDDRRYILRPEAIESVFILYRVTGDESLRDLAWEMFNSIIDHTKTEIANAALEDMTDPLAPKSNSMESFWTAETLKYFYLIFSDPGLISLDDYVFNTEAHPLRRPSTI
nr:mannosyl-oligosaccharide 1,2-alpha-mannosidase mns2 [Quercus suber]